MIINAFIRASGVSSSKSELVLVDNPVGETTVTVIVPLTEGQAINMVFAILTGLFAHGA